MLIRQHSYTALQKPDKTTEIKLNVPEVSSVTIEFQKILIVDRMVLVQQMAKKPGIRTVKYLVQQFKGRTLSLTKDFEEVILAFDTYKADSLKQQTREII